MSVIFFLIAVGVLVAGGFLAAFIWSVRSGQYDDDYTPSVRMLFDSPVSENDQSENDTDTSDEEEQSDKSNNNKN